MAPYQLVGFTSFVFCYSPHPQATKLYNRLIEFEPNNSRTLNNLGALQVLQSLDTAAYKTLSAALALDPDCVECLSNMASLYHVRDSAQKLVGAMRGEYTINWKG